MWKPDPRRTSPLSVASLLHSRYIEFLDGSTAQLLCAQIGVHFDADESIMAMGMNRENDENAPKGAGFGTSGFFLDYWQNSC